MEISCTLSDFWPPPCPVCYVLWVCFFFEAFPWGGVSPLTLEKLFLKWISNKIISFSYCKVKVINDYLTLLVKQHSLKSSNTQIKRLAFIVCIDNVIKTTIYHCKTKPNIVLKIIKNPPKKNFRLRRVILHPPWSNPGYGPEEWDSKKFVVRFRLCWRQAERFHWKIHFFQYETLRIVIY